MDEGNVGKDLAIEEKIESVVNKIKSGETIEKEELMIAVKGIGIPLTIEKDEKEPLHKINILGVHILTLEDEKLSFTEGWEDKLRANTEGIIDAEDLISELKEMELSLEKQREEQRDENEKNEEEIGEKEKDEEDLSKEKEQENSEKEENDNRTEEIAKKYNVNSNRVTHLSLTRKVAGQETLPELNNKVKGYKDVYVIPGKDSYSRIMIGIDKDGKEEEIQNDRSKGRIPNINIKLIEEDKITDNIKPYDYWPINNKEGMAVIKDSAGKDTLIHCRQEEGRGKEFQGVIIPEADTKNIDSNPKEVRDAMDYRQNSGKDLADRADRAVKQKKFEEELCAPSAGGKGIQIHEIEDVRKQKELNIQAYKEDLMQRDGVSLTEALKRNAMPGYYEKVDADYQRKAEEVYRLVAEEEMPYEDAVRKVQANDREKGGNTPDQNPRKRE